MYPLTMLFLVFSSVFLLIMTEEYLAEKRFAKETEKIRMKEYYMLCSLKEAEAMLIKEELPVSGTMSYLHGRVSYQTQALSPSTQKITFSLSLDSGETGVGIGVYDKEKKRMVKWIENN